MSESQRLWSKTQLTVLVNKSNMHNSAPVSEEWNQELCQDSSVITNEPSDWSHVSGRSMGCLLGAIKERRAHAWQWESPTSWGCSPGHTLACMTAATKRTWRPSLWSSGYVAGWRPRRAPCTGPPSSGLRQCWRDDPILTSPLEGEDRRWIDRGL